METNKIIKFEDLKKSKKVMRFEQSKDPAMQAWLRGVMAGYRLGGDCNLYEYYIRGLNLGFETSRQNV